MTWEEARLELNCICNTVTCSDLPCRGKRPDWKYICKILTKPGLGDQSGTVYTVMIVGGNVRNDQGQKYIT